VINSPKELLSLYVHIPFCKKRCSYCDFNTYAHRQKLIPTYVSALADEAKWFQVNFPISGTFHTLYFGGGTPSLIPIKLLEKTLQSLFKTYHWEDDVEITLEVNPGTIEHQTPCDLRQLGINRISLGVQTFDASELRLLGRIHTSQQILEAFQFIRLAGFENMNLDLIYGIPGQTLSSWKMSLQKALNLEPEHLSLYALTLADEVPLAAAIRSGKLPEIDDDLCADMYSYAREVMESNGYTHYEISNWAKVGDGQDFKCKHNLQYWRNKPYLGLGAGAHSHLNGTRWDNVLSPEEYIQRIQSLQVSGELPAAFSSFNVYTDRDISETIIMGLRLVEEGIDESDIKKRFGTTVSERYEIEVSRLLSQGLLEVFENIPLHPRLRLSMKGQLLANMVMREFISVT